MPYRLVIKPSAVRELEAIEPTTALERVVAAVRALAETPRPAGAEKLSGRKQLFRIRVGRLRVLYQVDEEARTVRVVTIGHRRDVYR
ncbi:MAG TPA: type II toxin-antitoxin system RelE/ParE family toxin [Candidatus Binatia bacterium]|nr:type II toxin-antitoxin system RelE/ParE family toxin [Candidatus Binatia bacterium]